MASAHSQDSHRPILFAHRGARAFAQENTIPSFQLALKLGATGLETDAWITKDKIAVLDHDGIARRFPRRMISGVKAGDLPSHIPTLDTLLATAPGVDLSIDVKDPDAFHSIHDVVLRSSTPPEKVWLCHPELNLLQQWKSTAPQFRYVHSIRLKNINGSIEAHIARLQTSGIEVLNMHHTDWTTGLVVLCHRFDIKAFAWDAQFPETLRGVLRMGVDAIYSDWVDRMVDAAR
jgi:glycerophosphoryl diester phosphodiesterase